ncbi:hypothetical protein ZIOFF_062440 [Zingiber officinale]|uniref:Uncharacterized protein n=1 Tax=Zingiber officinale TaxID=94328 RepID=A0A8J5K9B4_ZINOF|nr:hypothetical protein ZIOFF_062440 [Zingiber officinale]
MDGSGRNWSTAVTISDLSVLDEEESKMASLSIDSDDLSIILQAKPKPEKVIEHVADPADFCKSLAALTVPKGATIISTINRSMRSYATAIIAAEYLLNWLPKGTHHWSRFLTPEELVLILERAGVSVQEMAGFVYNPLTGDWTLSDDTSVNFIAFGTKRNE